MQVNVDRGQGPFLLKRSTLLFLAVFLYSWLCFFGHFSRGIHAYSMVDDDCYYYMKIASNIVSGHGSTFDGETLTNGYHPLWMGVITLTSAFTSRIENIIAAIYAIAIASTLATFFLARLLLRRFVSHLAVADISAVLVTIFASDLFRSGMEIILALPLALGLMEFALRSRVPWSPMRTFFFGVLSAVMILSRIDSIILAGLLTLFLLFGSELRRTVTARHFLTYVLGISPFLLYLASNVIWFGTLLPISGEAKQLRTTYSPSLRGIETITQICPLHGLSFFVAMLGLLWLPFAWKRLDTMAQAVLGAALLFPIAQILLLAFLSDWIMFPWYFYSSGIAVCASLIVWFGDKTSPAWPLLRSPLLRVGAMALLSFACATGIVRNTWHRPPSQRVMHALFIENFSTTHPGRYAMGDRAGFTSVAMPYPIVQTEGLVMDRRFLDHIRRQDDLLAVLREHRVRYYVATEMFTKEPAGCFPAKEPRAAGETAPHMQASLCMQPVATYEAPAGIKTLIFDLRPE